MKSIKASDIKFVKRTKHKRGTKKYNEIPWTAMMWDASLPNYVFRKLDATNRALAEQEAVEVFKDYFSNSIRSIAGKKHYKGVPTVGDLVDFYHEICEHRPLKAVRNANVNALKRVLTDNGSKNPLSEPVTVITSKLFRKWFSDRLIKRELECDGDVNEMDKEKRTLSSDWTKVRCIIKKEMINAMEDEGWDEAIWKHLKDVPSRVSTEKLYAPFDNEDFVRVPDELATQTWDKFKSLKYKDPNAYIVFLLGMFGGLRFKETVFLRWQDLGEDEVRVTKHDRWKPKGQRNRTVKVPEFVISEIREFEPEDKSKPFAQYCVSHPTPLRKVSWSRNVKAKQYKPQRREQNGKITWRIAYKYTTLSSGAKSPKYLTFKTEKEAKAKQKELLELQTEKSTTTNKVITVGGRPCSKTERGEGKTGNANNVQSRVNKILKDLGWDETGLVTTGKKFHKLRAWNITQVIENEDLYEAQKHAGHKKASTTATYYDTGIKKKAKNYLMDKLQKGKTTNAG